MPISALAGLSSRDAALSAIGQNPVFFKDVKFNPDSPQIKKWQAQHAAGEPITGFGDTGSFVPPSLSTSTARLNPQFFQPIPGRVKAPAPTTAPVALAPTPQPTAVNQTGSSAAGHGQAQPVKKQKKAKTRGTVGQRQALLFDRASGGLG